MELAFYIIFGIIALALLLIALKKPFWAVLILLFLLPFNALIVTYLTFVFELGSTGRFVITLWKEWLIFALLIRAVWEIIKNYCSSERSESRTKKPITSRLVPDKSGTRSKNKKWLPFKIYWFDWAVVGLFVLSLLTIIWGSTNTKQILYGLRYDFEFFLLYFIVRSFKFNLKQIKIAISAFLFAGLIVVIFGILQSLALPWNFLNEYGYSYFKEWQPGKSLQSTQIVEGTRQLSRIISTLSGPNQLASFLSFLILTSFGLILFAKNFRFKVFLALLILLSILPFFRTFSRSAWLGVAISLIILTVFTIIHLIKAKNKRRKPSYIGAVLVLSTIAVMCFSIFAFFGFKQGVIREMIYHPSSSISHIELMRQGVLEIAGRPFGQGLGSAGPASQWALGTKMSLVTESWYLQIGVEAGILGAVLFVGIIVGFLSKLYIVYRKMPEGFLKGLSFGLFLALISLSINAIFLHSFADTSTSLTLFALMGMVMSQGLLTTKNLRKY